MTKNKKTDKTMVDEILHRKLKNGQRVPYLFIKLHQLMKNPGVYRGSKDIDIAII
jgi:hypothetical protein